MSKVMAHVEGWSRRRADEQERQQVTKLGGRHFKRCNPSCVPRQLKDMLLRGLEPGPVRYNVSIKVAAGSHWAYKYVPWQIRRRLPALFCWWQRDDRVGRVLEGSLKKEKVRRSRTCAHGQGGTRFIIIIHGSQAPPAAPAPHPCPSS